MKRYKSKVLALFLEQSVSYYFPWMTCQMRLQCIFVCVAQKTSWKTTFQVEFGYLATQSSVITVVKFRAKQATYRELIYVHWLIMRQLVFHLNWLGWIGAPERWWIFGFQSHFSMSKISWICPIFFHWRI